MLKRNLKIEKFFFLPFNKNYLLLMHFIVILYIIYAYVSLYSTWSMFKREKSCCAVEIGLENGRRSWKACVSRDVLMTYVLQGCKKLEGFVLVLYFKGRLLYSIKWRLSKIQSWYEFPKATFLVLSTNRHNKINIKCD